MPQSSCPPVPPPAPRGSVRRPFLHLLSGGQAVSCSAAMSSWTRLLSGWTRATLTVSWSSAWRRTCRPSGSGRASRRRRCPAASGRCRGRGHQKTSDEVSGGRGPRGAGSRGPVSPSETPVIPTAGCVVGQQASRNRWWSAAPGPPLDPKHVVDEVHSRKVQGLVAAEVARLVGVSIAAAPGPGDALELDGTGLSRGADQVNVRALGPALWHLKEDADRVVEGADGLGDANWKSASEWRTGCRTARWFITSARRSRPAIHVIHSRLPVPSAGPGGPARGTPPRGGAGAVDGSALLHSPHKTDINP